MKDYVITMPNGTTHSVMDAPQWVIDEFASASITDLAEACDDGESPQGVYDRIQIEQIRRRLKL